MHLSHRVEFILATFALFSLLLFLLFLPNMIYGCFPFCFLRPFLYDTANVEHLAWRVIKRCDNRQNKRQSHPENTIRNCPITIFDNNLQPRLLTPVLRTRSPAGFHYNIYIHIKIRAGIMRDTFILPLFGFYALDFLIIFLFDKCLFNYISRSRGDNPILSTTYSEEK